MVVSRTLHGPAPAATPDVLATTCAAHAAGEYAVTRMTRAHMMVDTPDGMEGGGEDLAELRVLSRRVGDRFLRAQVASADAEAGMTRGRYEESRAAYQEALALAREVGAHGEEPFLLGRLAELSYRAGDLDAATKGLDEAEVAAIVLAELGLYGTAARVLGACELWRAGGPRSAVEEADLPWWWDGCARSWGPFGTRRGPLWGAA
ncbi:hypothetical protein ACIRD6_10305 [Streptomyces sp. NPDC102473]|uniref:hypothetical protein n=1 Tax=Streptomyces sp. NPDC102473 TaxID=3366180 RepID=UPI00382D17C8